MIEPRTLLAKSDGMSTVITVMVVISIIWQIIKRSTSEKTFRRANPIPRPAQPKQKQERAPLLPTPVFESVALSETSEAPYAIQPEQEIPAFAYAIPTESSPNQATNGLFETMPSIPQMMIWKEILDVPKAMNRQRRMRF